MRPVRGGDINEAFVATTNGGARVFVKLSGDMEAEARFDHEVRGLRALREAGARTPGLRGVLHVGHWHGLQLEYIAARPVTIDHTGDLARQLAAVHALAQNGFSLRGAYIGKVGLPDFEGSTAHELVFDGLIAPVVRLCGGALPKRDAAAIGTLRERSAPHFAELPPALVHGDLWSGNWLSTTDGRAALIDPSVHVGVDELDIALARLFGGFPEAFFAAYATHRPPRAGAAARMPILQLYFLLAHLAMFGRGYLPRLRSATQRALELC